MQAISLVLAVGHKIGIVSRGCLDRLLQYFRLVIDSIEDPSGFPSTRRAAYVPEFELLAIEWELPSIEVVPTEKEFAYVKSRDVIVRKSRPLNEIRQIYNGWQRKSRCGYCTYSFLLILRTWPRLSSSMASWR